MNIQKFSPHKRAEEKRLNRNQDVIDLMTGRFSQAELQERNSMFSGIDWSEVEIFEANGYRWKPDAVKQKFHKTQEMESKL